MKITLPKLGVLFVLLFPLSLLGQSTDTIDGKTVAPKAQNIEILDALKYPPKAILKKREGVVVVDIEVDKKGSYKGHNIVESADDILAVAVEPFMSKFIFSPGTKDGEPTDGVARIQIVFNIIKRIPIKTEITIKFEGQK